MRFLLILILLWPAALMAQELPCEAGKEKCEPLEDDMPKYARCMALICLEGKEAKKKNVGYNTCVKGAYKCAPLVDTPDEYWGCMRFECKAEDANTVERNCNEGKRECSFIVKKYYECATLVCKDKSWNLYEVCADGQEECAPVLEKFWECSQRVCLGKLRSTYKTPDEIRAERQSIIIPYLIHAYKKYDENVDPAYRLESRGGGPTSLLQCPAGAYIMCHSGNWYSCTCSDGTSPVSQTPKLIKRYQETGDIN